MSSTTRTLRSKEERDQLIEQYLPLVHHIVGRLTISLPSGVDREDLYSSGVLGLIHAAQAYDSAKGASFKTYAYTTIRGAILDEFRRLDPIPRSARERLKKLDKAHQALTHELGRPPSREELCQELGCDLETLDQDFVHHNNAYTLSIDEGADDSEGMSRWLEQAGALSPSDVSQRKEDIELLTKEIANLSEQGCQVVVLYYHEGLLLEEIGSILGVSESRVCQILSKALTVLRLALKS